jgi:hypothetical protein
MSAAIRNLLLEKVEDVFAHFSPEAVEAAP